MNKMWRFVCPKFASCTGDLTWVTHQPHDVADEISHTQPLNLGMRSTISKEKVYMVGGFLTKNLNFLISKSSTSAQIETGWSLSVIPEFRFVQKAGWRIKKKKCMHVSRINWTGRMVASQWIYVDLSMRHIEMSVNDGFWGNGVRKS